MAAFVATVFAAVGVAVAWRLSPFPVERLDRWPASATVTDREDNLLLTVVSRDEQWRFPVALDRLSPWLRLATVAVEDERFHQHPGVDPVAVARAVWQNLSAGRVISGASTLTMQMCRMMDDRPRTVTAKLVESFRALQLERIRSKEQILELYLNVAPYGGNLRGAEAAARAYFGKHAHDLSLGEAALLAGLPQSPSRYRPDAFPFAARARRERVLRRMVEAGMITDAQATAAAAEPVVAERRRRGASSPHVGWLALSRRPAGGRTTIDPTLQKELGRALTGCAEAWPAGTQAAAVMIDIAAAEVVAMVGSVDSAGTCDGQVNGVLARRSPGSTLKPFVYAAAIEAGLLNADSTVYDVPIRRAGWTPENFEEGFEGAMPAGEALRRSLNVPAILIAEAIGLSRCLGLIEAAGVDLPADVQTRGGLAVIVGATEVTLLDVTNAYATIGRGGIRRPARLFADEPAGAVPVIDRGVCATLDQILSSRHRRPRGLEALTEQNVPWFMWKTGTSSGRRDAWAVGHNGRHAVGVWVGRFAGGGAIEYIGGHIAEPVLAAVFDLPMIRRATDPPVPPAIAVRGSLTPPPELTRPLRILSPSEGAVLVDTTGVGTIDVRADPSGGLFWFLDGRPVELGSDGQLHVGPGSHELRCVTPAGEAAQVTFNLRPLATAGTVARRSRDR